MQLLDVNRAKVGTNQCATPVALTNSTSNTVTRGNSTDLWGNVLTAAWVKDPDFGVALGNAATAANTDVEIDYVTLEVFYTLPPTSLTAASMADGDRNWDTPSQDIALTFNEAVDITPAPNVGDTIAGLTAQVNAGANSALTYVSGNATASWKVRRAELIQQNDTMVLDYSQASGAILSVATEQEIEEEVDFAVTNNLTKRIRLTLKDKNNNTVNSTTVKYGILQYDSGAPANANWMTRDTKGTAATNASGLLDVQYTGSVAVGANVYVVVIQPDTTPTESFTWHQAVD